MADSDERQEFEYDFCLSFAGEQREYVEEVASELKSRGILIFFDDYEKAELWGKNLYAHLDEIYQHLGRYCILFASADYGRKVWTNHERRSAQARALKEKREYILPARFDDTAIPGLPDTVHYVDLQNITPKQLADIAIAKLERHQRHNYFPPIPDRLFERLEITDDEETCEHARRQASAFLGALRRMTQEERKIVLTFFKFGCGDSLPENVHINVDFLRRLTGKSVTRLKRVLGGIRSLGFECSVNESTEETHLHGEPLGDCFMFELNWFDLGDLSDYPALMVAHAMVHTATENYCEEHGAEFLERLDFSQLASATATEEMGPQSDAV